MKTLPMEVTAYLARRDMRLAHLAWHSSREAVARLNGKESAEFETRFGKYDWVPPHPSVTADGNPALSKAAGEDFLGSHRHMIQIVNAKLKELCEPPIDGWKKPPKPGDMEFRVPLGVNYPTSIYRSKDDRVWKEFIREAEKYFTDPYLKSVELGVMGAEVEYKIHAAMHERFGAYSSIGRRMVEIGGSGVIDPKWDNPAYDSLLDPYSSHVHPWFWKIHGWVDSLIAAWETANGKKARLKPWLGPMEHTCHHGMDHCPCCEEMGIASHNASGHEASEHEMSRSSSHREKEHASGQHEKAHDAHQHDKGQRSEKSAKGHKLHHHVSIETSQALEELVGFLQRVAPRVGWFSPKIWPAGFQVMAKASHDASDKEKPAQSS